MTTLHITVGDRAQARESALEFVQAGEDGDLVDGLTPTRLELIRAIVEHEPESMRAAARLVDRNISDVHGDLKHLEVLGALRLEEGGPGGAMQPAVPFDRIEMHIDYPLLGDHDHDGASANG